MNEIGDEDEGGIGDTADNCDVIWNANQTDTDNDAIGDACDVNGDGLMELWNAVMLHNVRHQLNGTGYRESVGGAVNDLGCGGRAGVDLCNGHELIANISIEAYGEADGGMGWQPLGNDTDRHEGGSTPLRASPRNYEARRPPHSRKSSNSPSDESP